MKKTLFFLLIPVIFSLIYSCSKPPVYPKTPSIEFKELVKYGNGDSVRITISYKDGDGDLGLTTDDVTYPYQRFDFIKDINGDFIRIGSSPSLPEYNCHDYTFIYPDGQVIDIDNDGNQDTLLISENPNFYNYFIDILIKQPNGTFVPLDLKFDPSCLQFNERFPLLNSEDGPIKGDLSYKIELGTPLLANKTIKFRIYIQDRNLNKSNTIETSEVFITF